MPGATSGRLVLCGDFGVRGPLSRTSAAISGPGVNKVLGAAQPKPGTGQPGGRAPFIGIVAPLQPGDNPVARPTQGYTGNYKIAGTTLLDGFPTSARVMLNPAKAPGLCIAEVDTDAATGGVFVFLNVAPGLYTVEAIDPTGVENNPIRASVLAVPM
jgi:hypothetical protein